MCARPGFDADDGLGVARLASRRHQLVVSSGGLWVRARRHRSVLDWDEIDQIQLTPTLGGGARIEVFRRDGSYHSSGPFPRSLALRWIQRCQAAAAADGRTPRTLDGAIGFGLIRPNP